MSALFELSFGKIIKLNEDIAEVIVNEGVEMDLAIIAEYHEWLLNNLKAPFMILVNKINRYTYTFDAQKKLGDLPQIRAMAVISYSRSTDISTRSMVSIPRENQWNIEIFSDRAAGLKWLESHRE